MHYVDHSWILNSGILYSETFRQDHGCEANGSQSTAVRRSERRTWDATSASHKVAVRCPFNGQNLHGKEADEEHDKTALPRHMETEIPGVPSREKGKHT